MDPAGHRFASDSLLRTAVALGLVAVMLLLSSGELLAGHCDQDCESPCDESCPGCDDCIYCVSKVHMAPTADFDHGLVDQTCGWTLPLRSLQREDILSAAIDHPPQNLR